MHLYLVNLILLNIKLFDLLYPGERKEKWVALSIDPRKGLGLFVKGKVRKRELLAVYKGLTTIYTSDQQIPTHFDSGYVMSWKKDDGTVIVIDGNGADKVYGTAGHFINTELAKNGYKSLIPVYYEYSEKYNAFLIYSKFAWDSGAY